MADVPCLTLLNYALKEPTERGLPQPRVGSTTRTVHVKSFDMPFGDMVMFMVKWALASIPAFIILFIIFGILFAIFG